MKNIFVSDVSLRELGGASALSLSFKEKLEIAKLISELGVDTLELSSVGVEKADEVLVKTISACVNKSMIAIATGYTEESVQKNYSLIATAKKKRLIVSVPVSPVQMEYFASKKPKAILELLETLTKKAVSLCGDVEVCLDDATRADVNFLHNAIQTAIDCGAKTITINDMAGLMMPDDFAEFIKGIYFAVPTLSNVKFNVECSDEFSMATANMLSAISVGVSGVKLSAIRGKLANIESFCSAVDYIGGKRGICCSLNKTAMNRILNRVSNLTVEEKSVQPENNTNDETENIAKGITQSALSKMIKQRGYDLTAPDVAKVYAEIVRYSNKKEINTKDLDVIIASVALQVPATYELVSFSVQSSNVLTSTASIVLNKNGKEISGLSYGNGAIDASFLALENIIGSHYELDSFEVNAVTAGKEAMGETIVKLRADGKLYSGRGVSTDIVGASIKAYVSAVNKIVYKESN
ncbi:MAG: hypothetical protein E7362_04515 [Clostridiales bacterium]|nr:hypothetical protein [Clostridiales bacterium]